MNKTSLLICFLLIGIQSYAQVEYNAIQIFGHEEGAAVVNPDQWHVVSKTLYTAVEDFFSQPVPAGHVREYHLGIRKADNIDNCSVNGSKFRFWFSWKDQAGHAFDVPRDWGQLNEGAMHWVKIPGSNDQASALSITSQKYWRVEAKIPSACNDKSMKIFGLWLKAVDVPGGSGASIVLNADGEAIPSDYLLGGPGGILKVNNEKFELLGQEGIQITDGNSEPNAYMRIKPNIDVSALNPGSSTVAASITNRRLGHLVLDIEANDGNDSFAVRTDSNHDGEVDKVALVVKPTGNLLIGKTSQTNTSYKLDVAGKARVDEIVVNTTGADYVFEDNYKLRDLEEVEAFIAENNHLPGIPSAAEMQEKGMSVGQLNTKLLEKIEELTLYVIELKKENKDLKSRMNQIETFSNKR